MRAIFLYLTSHKTLPCRLELINSQSVEQLSIDRPINNQQGILDAVTENGGRETSLCSSTVRSVPKKYNIATPVEWLFDTGIPIAVLFGPLDAS